MGQSGHFYSYMDPVWSLLIVRTSFVPWVELFVQRRLCPIFMSGVGLPTSTSIPQVDGLSMDPREMELHKREGRREERRERKVGSTCHMDATLTLNSNFNIV